MPGRPRRLDATAIASENLVCLLHSDALNADIYRGGVSQVLQARFDSAGRLKLRANGRRFGCGPLGDVISYGQRMDCYLTTLGTGAGQYDWESACVAAGMIVLPVFDHDADAGDEVGVCAGPEGSRLGPPAVPRLATTGVLVLGD